MELNGHLSNRSVANIRATDRLRKYFFGGINMNGGLIIIGEN
jgi:hypothetical protein